MRTVDTLFYIKVYKQMIFYIIKKSRVEWNCGLIDIPHLYPIIQVSITVDSELPFSTMHLTHRLCHSNKIYLE